MSHTGLVGASAQPMLFNPQAKVLEAVGETSPQTPVWESMRPLLTLGLSCPSEVPWPLQNEVGLQAPEGIPLPLAW